MKLKTVLIAVAFALGVSTAATAQSPKFGHFDMGAFLEMLPEAKEIEKTMDAEQSKIETQLTVLSEDFQRMYKDYQQKASTMSESDRIAKEQELQELQQRVVTFRQTAMQDLQKKQQELVQPLVLKVRKAVQEIGATEGFLYIFEQKSQLVLHAGMQSEDITPLMKKKFGMK